MERRYLLIAGGAALLGGCTEPRTPPPAPIPDALPLETAGPTPSPSPTRPAPPPDTRTGAQMAQPYTVDGLAVVSKAHRVSAAYVPAWAARNNGLHADVQAGFDRLAAAAKSNGLHVSIRSGYRSFNAQKASFDRAMKNYPEATARRYFAEPGASEHQTGLSLDAWDGTNRGDAFARTQHAAWLARHAHEHGFIVRYPQGKTDITGYAWESWHLRWVGPLVSAAFGPDSTLTLEEYLGLA